MIQMSDSMQAKVDEFLNRIEAISKEWDALDAMADKLFSVKMLRKLGDKALVDLDNALELRDCGLFPQIDDRISGELVKRFKYHQANMER